MVGYFLGKLSMVGGVWSVVGVTAVGGRWSVAGRWAVVFHYAISLLPLLQSRARTAVETTEARKCGAEY